MVILGQCSSEAKNQLVNNVGFETLEDSDDVVGLLKMLKEMTFSTSGVQHPPMLDTAECLEALDSNQSRTK